ncbi:MAG: hypothetical protein JRI23_30860 [Deltaproteobacteria bacterium]|jgi:hypothetical protein|nr:hypothetical protein [Deltaproteobacteria bacterium]MBW2536599.1 hypothetical protein [Deltaproteobacteria bacterium]
MPRTSSRPFRISVAGDSLWDNVLVPPPIEPAQVDTFLTKQSLEAQVQSLPSVNPGKVGPGNVYVFTGDGQRDLVIDLSGEAGPGLPYPIKIDNYRNVIVRGLFLDLVVQPGNDIGELNGVDGTSSPANLNPRLCHGGYVFRVDVLGSVWIEGCDVQVNGQEGDYVIWRGVNATSQAGTRTSLVNSRFEGNVGDRDEAIHADHFHNQGAYGPDADEPAICERLEFENVVFRSGQESVTAQSSGGAWQCFFWCRNVDSQLVRDWYRAGVSLGRGAALATAEGTLSGMRFENIMYGRDDGDDYKGCVIYTDGFGPKVGQDDPNTRTLVDDAYAGGTSVGHPELSWYNTQGPMVDFAPRAQIGWGYVSPFGPAA